MIYAIRQNGSIRTLVELPSRKELRPGMEVVSPSDARKWVLQHKLHETALWVDEGRVKRAKRAR